MDGRVYDLYTGALLYSAFRLGFRVSGFGQRGQSEAHILTPLISTPENTKPYSASPKPSSSRPNPKARNTTLNPQTSTLLSLGKHYLDTQSSTPKPQSPKHSP